MTVEDASRYAALALAGVDREYPNKPNEVLSAAEDLRTPRQLHPAFFGCFDWHSAVHGHWLLVRLLRLFPELPSSAEARAVLERHLTAANLEGEAAYFRRGENAGFERMYGWAWALRLTAELRGWSDPQAARWSSACQPLERELVRLTHAFLPRLTYPVRVGTHADTGFALGQIWDYAAAIGDGPLREAIGAAARLYYEGDRDYPSRYEPSGEDFFSSGLNEADLMRRVLPRGEYAVWLDGFLPGLGRGDLGAWAEPARVSDASDPRIVHLVGLNLSRAWTLRGVASALEAGDKRRGLLEAAASAHQTAGLAGIFTGDYGGEHWLATFAVYLLTG